MRPNSQESILLLLASLQKAGVQYTEPSHELLFSLLGYESLDAEEIDPLID